VWLHRRRASCCRRDPRTPPQAVWGKRPGQHSQPNEVTVTTGRVQPDMTVFSKILKAGEGKRVRQLAELVPPINELADEMAALSDEELRAKTDEFRARLAEGEDLDDMLLEPSPWCASRDPGARSASLRRPADGRHGPALWWIAEMKTGEGKTLVSTLPVYLNALAATACTSSP